MKSLTPSVLCSESRPRSSIFHKQVGCDALSEQQQHPSLHYWTDLGRFVTPGPPDETINAETYLDKSDRAHRPTLLTKDVGLGHSSEWADARQGRMVQPGAARVASLEED